MKSIKDSMGRRWDETKKRTLESLLKECPPRFGSRKAPDGKLGPEPVPDISYLEPLQVCEKHGLAYFSHFLEKQAGKHKSAGLAEDMSLGDAFDHLTEAVSEFDRHVWAYQDGSVFQTCCSFVDALEAEIPAAILAKYRNRAASNSGYLTLDDAAEFAGEITQKQASNVPRDVRRMCPSMFSAGKTFASMRPSTLCSVKSHFQRGCLTTVCRGCSVCCLIKHSSSTILPQDKILRRFRNPSR